MRQYLIVAVGMLLSACLTTGKRGGDAPLAIYDFGPAPAATITARSVPLALEVRAPLWFDTMGIDYRLLYSDGAHLREYAVARWAGPPAQLVQQRLMQQLAYSYAGQSRSRCLVRLEITEFSQQFTQADKSYGVLQGRAIFFDRSRQPLAEQAIDIREPSPTPNARGGVAALTASVVRMTEVLAVWEDRLTRAGRLRECAG